MKNKNEMCQKTVIANGVIIPASVTANIVGCSVSAVKKVRNGFIGKTGRGKVCQSIVVVDQLLHQGVCIAVDSVNNLINNK